MKVIETDKTRIDKRTGGIFIGTVDYTPLVSEDTGSKEFIAGIVTFPPGTRNKFHIHDHEQIVFLFVELKNSGKMY